MDEIRLFVIGGHGTLGAVLPWHRVAGLRIVRADPGLPRLGRTDEPGAEDDISVWREAIVQSEADAVLNLAGRAAPASRDWEQLYSDNVRLVEDLCRAVPLGVPLFHMSSVAAASAAHLHPPLPPTKYAISKLLSERVALSLRPDTRVMRLGGVTGHRRLTATSMLRRMPVLPAGNPRFPRPWGPPDMIADDIGYAVRHQGPGTTEYIPRHGLDLWSLLGRLDAPTAVIDARPSLRKACLLALRVMAVGDRSRALALTAGMLLFPEDLFYGAAMVRVSAPSSGKGPAETWAQRYK